MAGRIFRKIKKLFKFKLKINNERIRLVFTVRKTVILFIISIIAISFSLFFYFQHETETKIRNSIFEQQKEIQLDNAVGLSKHIESDLDSILSRLQNLAYILQKQNDNQLSDDTLAIFETFYIELNSITVVDRLFVMDKNDITQISIAPSGELTYLGMNFSYRDWAKETKESLSPVFSDGFIGRNGKVSIAITYPIVINSTNTLQYHGLVGVIIPTITFFKHYGNIHDIDSRYLAVVDSKARQLIHPLDSLVGKPFFGNYSQEVTGHNKALNNLIETVVESGQVSSAIYDFRNGERLNVGHPVNINGSPKYFIFIITPTSTIYSKINDIIFNQRLETFALIVGIIAAILVLAMLLIKWNSVLEKEVKIRTKELESANEKLTIHDKMQKEFINTAAHELRTPIQPILGLTEIIQNRLKDQNQKELLDVVIRNAKRLKKLAEDILDVTKIDSKSLVLKKEYFSLLQTINDFIKEHDNNSINNNYNNKNKKISFVIPDEDVIIYADKNRISQVISNFIENSIKFIQIEGSITVTVREEIEGNRKMVVLSVRDTGTGIDFEVLPKLFTKFTSKSFQGTGLGLYISKRIIEAHGGRIWAENNTDDRGATFSFSLPL